MEAPLFVDIGKFIEVILLQSNSDENIPGRG
jgi:hypothetical protein